MSQTGTGTFATLGFRSIRIGGRRFRIKLHDPAVPLNGYMDPNLSILGLSRGLGDEKTAQALIHEIFHGIFEVYGSPPDLTEEMEETVVDKLAVGWLLALAENPKLGLFLQRVASNA